MFFDNVQILKKTISVVEHGTLNPINGYYTYLSIVMVQSVCFGYRSTIAIADKIWVDLSIAVGGSIIYKRSPLELAKSFHTSTFQPHPNRLVYGQSYHLQALGDKSGYTPDQHSSHDHFVLCSGRVRAT